MRGNRPVRRMGPGTRIVATVVAWSLCTIAAGAQSKPYVPKNGVLNWKAIVLGGAFRVTTAIPLHGDFAKYDRVEVVRATSVIGPDVPAPFLRHLTDQLAGEFRKGGRFADVAVVETCSPSIGSATRRERRRRTRRLWS
jgi:hypothetical protein